MSSTDPILKPGVRLYFLGLSHSRRTVELIERTRAAGFEVLDSGAQAQACIVTANFARQFDTVSLHGASEPVPAISSQTLRNVVKALALFSRVDRRRRRAEQQAARLEKAKQRREHGAMRRQHRLVGACGKRSSHYRIGF